MMRGINNGLLHSLASQKSPVSHHFNTSNVRIIKLNEPINTMFYYLLLFLVLFVITNHFLNQIRNLPPSPFPTLPVIGHLHLLRKPIHRSLSKISNQHNRPILLLQFGYRRVLLVSSPSFAKECFTENDVVFANRPLLLAGKHLGYNFRSFVWAPYGDRWRSLRKLSSLEILSSKRLQLLSGIRKNEVNLLIQRLYRNKEENHYVDMKRALFELMLNVMMRMIAGKRYYGENLTEVETASRFQEMVRETFEISSSSMMGDYLPLLVAVGSIGKRLMDLQRKRDAFIQELIEEHRKRILTSDPGSSSLGETNYKTMIEVLLSLQASEPEFYTDETIKSLMLDLLTAGTDTSTGTMEWAMSLLLNNPDILRKAQEELDEVIGHNRLIDESDMVKLPYLHCIIKETMRMYPAGPLLAPHESSEACTIGGYHIPKGTMLLVNLWGIHNDPKIWEEPTKFKPERFEGCEGVTDGFKFMPFGYGRRACPGEGLTLRMVGLTLASLLQCFDWQRIGTEMVDMTEGDGHTLTKAKPLVLKCRPRLSMVNLLSQI